MKAFCRTISLFSLASLALFSFPAFAAPLFILKDPKNLKDPQNQLAHFFQKAENALPEQIRKVIPYSIEVDFKDLDTGNFVSSITDICSKKNSGTENHTLDGYVQRKNLIAGPYQIVLNQGFLFEILKGEQNSTAISCRQKNMYALALATLIHELGHVYDYSKELTTHERSIRSECESGEKEYRKLPGCRQLRSRRGAVSESAQFLNLGHWTNRSTSVDLKTSGKPDTYEKTNANEFFAVNFETFILDPEFRCRRPALYEFYREHFGVPLIPQSNCQINNRVYESSSGLPITLDAKKIHSVRYMMSSAGEAKMSKFGHAYLQLIMCAPERKTVDDSCLKDTAHHIIVDFTARVETTNINYFSGVFGGYFTGLNIYRTKYIMNEANYDENRDLFVYPIQLSREQIQLLTNEILGIYWGYASEYFFLSNNCSSEISRVLRALLPSDHSAHDPDNYIQKANSPETLRKGLIYSGLIKSREPSHIYKSIQSVRDTSFQNVASKVGALLNGISSAKEYVEKADTDLRQQIMDKLQKEAPHDTILWSSVYILEQAVYQAVYKKTLADVYEHLNKSDFINYREAVPKDLWFTPDNFINSRSSYSYGIPLNREVIADTDVKSKWVSSEKPREEFLKKLWQRADSASISETQALLELAKTNMSKK